MLSKISKTILFFLAYVPLVVLLMIKNIQNPFWIISASAILVVLSLALTAEIFKVTRNVHPHRTKVTIIESKNHEMSSFFVTYIVPLVVTIDSGRDLVVLIILMSFILYFYLKSSLFVINPLLEIVLRHTIYETVIKNKKVFLISNRERIPEKTELEFIILSKDVVLEVNN